MSHKKTQKINATGISLKKKIPSETCSSVLIPSFITKVKIIVSIIDILSNFGSKT